jgi:hypothetical protein
VALAMNTPSALFARFERVAIASVVVGGLLANPVVSSAQAPPPPISSPFVSISTDNQTSPSEIAKFDAVWMSPDATKGRLARDDDAMHRRQGWIAWGLAEEAPAMERMYTLTHDPKYVEYLRQLAIIVLRYRDDRHPGGGDPLSCFDCKPPFNDMTRNGFPQAAWGQGDYGGYVQGGGLHPVDEVRSGIYNHTLAAFARIVLEDPSLQSIIDPVTPDRPDKLDPNGHTYVEEAVAAANAALETYQVFAPQFWARTSANDGIMEGTFNRSPVAPRPMYDCVPARNAAVARAQALITDPQLLSDTLKDINRNSPVCTDALQFAGAPLAHNESGSLMMSFIELWRALDTIQYQSSLQRSPDADAVRNMIPLMAARHQRYFVNRLQTRQDGAQGERYWWHYNDDVVREHAEDTDHGHLDMRYVYVLKDSFDRLNAIVTLKGEPLDLDDGMLRRFANTFLEQLARPNEIDTGGEFRGDMDARTADDMGKKPAYYSPLCDGWVDLASVDATIFRICRDVTTRVLEGEQNNLTIANHSDLLLNKRFARPLADINLTRNASLPTASSDPTAWVFASGNVQDVAYHASNGHAYELYRTLTGSGATDLTYHAHASVGPADIVRGYEFPSFGTHNEVYRGTDGHVHGLWWTCCEPTDDDLTRLTGLPGPVGNPLAYASPVYGVQNVIYRASGGRLFEMYWSNGAVSHDELTALPGVPLAAGDPTGYFINAQGVQHVFYRTTSGDLEHLSWGTGAVTPENLSARVAMFGIPLPAGDPVAYLTPDAKHTVVFRGVDSKLYEVKFGDGFGLPTILRLSDLAPAAPLPVGDPHAYFDPNDGNDHILYRTSNGHLHELVLSNRKMRQTDLTTAVGTDPSAGKPFGYVFGADNTEHVLFRSSKDGHIHDVTWQDPTSMVFVG